MRAVVVILVVGIVALIAALLLIGPGATVDGPINVPRIEATAVDGWERAWHAALARAGRDDRPMLVLFTGSDWCPACVQLRREVLVTPGFRAWAQAKLVLLELDFPLRTAQTAAVVAQNQALHRHFAIAGYPSVLLLTARGVELGRIEGLPPGGPDGFVAKAEAILAGR